MWTGSRSTVAATLGLTYHWRQARRDKTRPVHLEDLPSFRSALLMNSIIPGQPIVGINGTEFTEARSLMTMLLHCCERNEG